MSEIQLVLICVSCLIAAMAGSSLLLVLLSMNSARISRDEELAEEIARVETKLKLHKWSEGHTD